MWTHAPHRADELLSSLFRSLVGLRALARTDISSLPPSLHDPPSQLMQPRIDLQPEALRPCASSLATSSFGRTRSKPCTILS
eukprot:691603-Hanusia_phi.AAC.1